MPGTYTYALGSWRWNPAELAGRGAYVAPPGSVCVLDYRNEEQQSQPSRTDGCGLFAFAGVVPEDLVPLGTGYAPELMITPTARQEMQLRLGLSGLPAGDTLAQAAVSCFMDYGDPTGIAFARPLDLNAAGDVELWLEGHSCVHRERYDYRELLAAQPKGRANRLRDLARVKLDIADSHGKLGEALGLTLMRCGYSQAEVAAGAKGRRGEWQQLVSQGMRTKHGAKLAAKEPRTSFAESWPNATGNLSLQAQDQPWSVLSVTGFTGGLKVASNSVRAAGAFANALGVCGSAVSSADHWAQGVFAINDPVNATVFVTARNSSNAGTFYAHGVQRTGAYRSIIKCVNGVATTLYGPTGTYEAVSASGKTFKASPAASTITGTATGLTDRAVTDPAIVGNLRGGVWIYLDAAVETYGFIGAWSIDDGVVPAPVADFSATPLSGTASLSVAFTDLSTNTPTSWTWERSSNGGGSWTTFSTSQNPTASFAAGTWSVRLTATNAGGSDAETKLAYIVSRAPNRIAVAGQHGLGVRHGMGL